MNDLLKPYLRRFILVFFYDILVYSHSYKEHLIHLSTILELLATNHFVAKFSKCEFGVACVYYLGHLISAQGVAADPDKVRAIVDWPQPCSLSALRGFLGLTGFYRRFVRHYATLTAPLTDMLKTNTFNWTTAALTTFTELKTKMSSMPVLALPNFSSTFVVETDASTIAIGAVLSQFGHPLAFFSKKMGPKLQASSAYVQEMFAGSSNKVADALSRQFSEGCLLLFSITSPVPSILTKLQKFYTTQEGKEFITKLIPSQNTNDCFSFQDNLLLFRGHLFVPDIADLRSSLIQEFHSTSTAGHSALKPSLASLAASFYWPISSQVWEELSMDFITHLPNAFGHTTIWVICDRLTKFAHFIALPSHYSTSACATRFSIKIFRLYCIPSLLH